MNLKKAILILLAIVPVIFTSCKKDNGSANKLNRLAVMSITPSSPRVDSAFTVRVVALDEDGGNQVLNSNTTVTLSLASGTGTLTGTLTATMEAPSNVVTFTNVKYDVVESGVIIKATASGGEELKDGISASFTVTGPMLIFKFKFDSLQTRLDAFGNVSSIPAGHAAQSPKFNSMSAHYIELAETDNTLLGNGEVLYVAAQTTAGGDTAIDFDKSVKVGEGQVFFSVPIKTITAGTYKWLRISLAYQNYDIKFRYTGNDVTGTIASFIGYETYINDYKIKTTTQHVGANKLQGYWGFETTTLPYPPPYNTYVTSGQAPPGATTVPNPLSSSSPIPAGSCVVTGQFNTGVLTIPPTTHTDIVVTVSVSTQKSFEWMDSTANGIYDTGEAVVDMGVRGIIPYVVY